MLARYTIDEPTSAVAGEDFIVTITPEDAFGNLRNGALSVTLSAEVAEDSPGAGILSSPTHGGPAVIDTSVGSVTVTDLRYTKAEAIKVKADDGTVSSRFDDIANTIEVNPNVVDSIGFTTQPSATAIAGVSFMQQPEVALYDEFGNTCTNDSDTEVTLAVVKSDLSPATTLLSGTTTLAAFGTGVVSYTDIAYTIVEEPAGQIVLKAEAQGVSGEAYSNPISISPGEKDKLLWVVPPSSLSPVTAGVPWGSFSVEIMDTYDNRIDCTDNVTVTPYIGNTPASFDVSSTASAVSGLVTFSNLVYTASCGTIRVIASAPTVPKDSQPSEVLVNLTDVTLSPPASGAYYQVGESMTISWTEVGNVSNYKVEYYVGEYSEPTAYDIVTIGGNSYAWTVPDFINSGVKIRVSDADNPDNFGDSDPFDIKGRLAIDTPSEYIAYRDGQISWDVSGDIGQVALQYRSRRNVSDTYSEWTDIDTISSGWATGLGLQPQDGSYSWGVVADVIYAEHAGDADAIQDAPDVEMQLKVADADDADIYAETTPFTVRYYKITWLVADLDGNPVLKLNVDELLTANPIKPVWKVEDGSFSGNRSIRYYAYNGGGEDELYDTTFSREEAGVVYSANKKWIADADKVVEVEMETAATAMVTYRVEIIPTYDTVEDAIVSTAWLTRKGLLVEDVYGDLTAKVQLDIYDSAGALLDTLGAGIDPNASGVFSRITYDPAVGLDPSEIYILKAIVTRRDNDYAGTTVFIVPSVVAYDVNIATAYNSDHDSIMISIWHKRSGTMVTDPGNMTWTISDSDGTELETRSYNGYDSPSPSEFLRSDGVYSGLEWRPAGEFISDKIYSIKASIEYRGKTYSALASFAKTKMGEIASSVSNVEELLGTAADGAEAETLFGKVSAVHTIVTLAREAAEEVKEEITKEGGVAELVKEAKEAAVEARKEVIGVTELAEEAAVAASIAKEAAVGLEKKVISRILNQESYVGVGTELSIKYKTEPGVASSITVYDEDNVALADYYNRTMTEVPADSGIYEYPVTFDATGEHTIICSSDNGAMDGVTLKVLSTDLERIGAEVTTTMARVITLEKNLEASMAGIEEAIASVTQTLDAYSRLTGKLERVSPETIEAIYSQLSMAAEKLDALSKEQGVNLERMYEVSEEQSTNINYLKNKIMEIKALTEINREILERTNDKPIVKNWLESTPAEEEESE